MENDGTSITVGLTDAVPVLNVRGAVKYWRKAIARGVLEHGILVPKKPAGRSAAETAEAMKALEKEGVVVVTEDLPAYTKFALRVAPQ